MGPGPFNKSGKGKGRKTPAWEFNSPQVMPSSYMSAWSDVKIPKASNSVPHPQSGKKLYSPPKKGIAFDRFYEAKEAKEREGRLHIQQNGTIKSVFHDSALEHHPSKERNGSDLIRRPSNPNNLISGDRFECADKAGAGRSNKDPDAELNSSPLTMEDGSSERRVRLKNATSSQKQDKSTGKKKNKEKGGLENVFNARSPTQENFKILIRDKSTTPTQARNRASTNNSSTSSLPGSSTKAVPLQSLSITPTRSEQRTSHRSHAYESNQGKSAAVTEAQLQAHLLRRSGHREFSSHTFDGSNDDENEPNPHEGLARGKKKDKKKRKAKDIEIDADLVEAEIAKQRASYNDYMSKRIKENPDHYFNSDVNLIHELTSEGESDRDKIHDRRCYANSGIGDNIIPVEDERGSAYKVNTPRSVARDNRNQVRSATKKDKDRRKRMRARDDELIGEEANAEGSRKKARAASKEKHRLFGTEAQNSSVGGRGSSDDPATRKVARSVNTVSPTGSTATYTQHQKPVSLQQLRNAPPMTVITENASANADFITTLKSFWGIIPKALLHTTMTHLNKANRQSLDAKLKLCEEGKQTNPHIRIVTRINENGDEVELLEEYGRISEPDPHTMSSELTLLTAAKDLIGLLSAQRVSLGLSSVISSSREVEMESASTYIRGQSTQGCVGEVSPLEEELSRIASEYQREIEKLREENRDLSAQLKKGRK